MGGVEAGGSVVAVVAVVVERMGKRAGFWFPYLLLPVVAYSLCSVGIHIIKLDQHW